MAYFALIGGCYKFLFSSMLIPRFVLFYWLMAQKMNMNMNRKMNMNMIMNMNKENMNIDINMIKSSKPKKKWRLSTNFVISSSKMPIVQINIFQLLASC